MIRRISRKIYLGFYTVGFFVTLGVGILILVAYSRSLTQPQFEILPTPDTGQYLYVDEKLEISIQYPTDWIVVTTDYPSQGHREIIFQSPDLDYIETDSGGSRIQGSTLSIYGYPSNIDDREIPEDFINSEKITIDGRDGYKAYFSEFIGRLEDETMVIFFSNESNAYEATCHYHQPNRLQATAECDQIIQTIRFLSQD